MLSRHLVRIGQSYIPARRRNARGMKKSTRFHAERLEDRFMMSADGAAAMSTGVAVFAPGDPSSAAAAFVSRTINEASIPKAVNGDLQRFQSTEEFDAWLVEAATAQFGHLFGQPIYHYGWNWLTFDAVGLGTNNMAPALRASATVSFNSGHSQTNVQVAGVDEADVVETDGEYLYIISGEDLVIVNAGIGNELTIVSRVHLDERPVGMYLSGNRLALVSSSVTEFNNIIPVARPLIWADRPLFTDVVSFSMPEIKPPTTTVTVLDITDRAAPTLVHKTEMDGELVTSRAVDGQLRLVLTNGMHLPTPIARPIEQADEVEEVEHDPKPIVGGNEPMIADRLWFFPMGEPNYVYETRDEYLARVREEILESAGPQVRSLSLDGSVISETPLLDATEIYRPASHLNSSAVTVATFDLTSNASGPAATETIMTSGRPQVYVDNDSIYVFAEQAANDHQSGQGLRFLAAMPTTGVWKFQVDNQSHEIELVATGHFDGAILNQFAADEHDGRLRVVTQPYWSGTGQSVHVLEQDGDELKVVGSLAGVAMAEQLYSVRFIEDTVFFVTFRQVDPLFVVDLSDPANPQMKGELHIPGFYDYLQPIDENHLLAVGRDADENTGAFEELQVSIFDISDLTDPLLLHRYTFEGGRSTATPVSGNRWVRGDGDHHAASYFASEQIFALPIYTPEDIVWWADVDRDAAQFEAGQGGLQVFRIDIEGGFVPLGLIEHDTLVERSMQIGEHLYAISSGMVTVHELTNPNVGLGELDIAPDAGAETVTLTMYETQLETSTSETSERGLDRPAPRGDWLPPAPSRSPHKPTARTVALSSISISQPLDDELVHSIAIEAESAVELPAIGTPDDRPGPRVEWIPFVSARSPYKPPVRTADFGTISLSQPVDDDLIYAIAIDAEAAAASTDASTLDSRPIGSTMADAKDADQPDRQLLARRSAFRPVATRFAR
jgi:uncharacterized secreted protein with C-terminal beta-propeller domain